MFKILSDEAICRECARQLGGNPCDPNVSRLDCSLYPQMEAYLKGAQAQAREDAKELLESQTSLTILDPLGGPKEAWISIKMPWEDYEAMKKLAQLAD